MTTVFFFFGGGSVWGKQLKKCSRNVLRSQENVVCVLAHSQQSGNNGGVAIVSA